MNIVGRVYFIAYYTLDEEGAGLTHRVFARSRHIARPVFEHVFSPFLGKFERIGSRVVVVDRYEKEIVYMCSMAFFTIFRACQIFEWATKEVKVTSRAD